MAEFRTIHTKYGLAALTRAEATGTPINLTHMAVGDGAGNPVMPGYEQTGLAREMYRAPVNRVFQAPNDPNRFTAELVIPASVGGFVLREVGIFDDAGTLFAVGNLPETYKPTADDGAFADTIVRMDFMVSNANVVTLQLDPNVAVATQAWISNNVTAGTLIPGGTTWQVLRKVSNADGDTEWADPATANVVVDMIEERQTLASGQTRVVLSAVTTRGLAVYVNGLRIPNAAGAGGWLAAADDPDTTVVLGQAYPAGAAILLVQNEPTGSVPYPLVRDLNLSDVPDKALARANMDVFSKAEARQMAPAGEIAHFARSTAPAGWLKANGAAVSRTAYAELFAAIGTTFGGGDGFNTFNLPDLRGEFVRGWDDGRSIDSGRGFGSSQASDNKSHSHTTDSTGSHSHSVNDPGHSHSTTAASYSRGSYQYAPGDVGHYPGWAPGTSTGGAATSISLGSNGAHTHAISSDGGSESRPRNIALLACIKF